MDLDEVTEKRMERLLNRVSLVLAAISTVALLHLISRSSLSCPPAPTARGGNRHPSKNPTHPTAVFLPRTSCEAASREILTLEKRFAKLRSSRAWRQHVDAFSALFATFRPLGILTNASHVLCVSSGAGYDVAALQESGVADVTGVDLIDFHPLVHRADPHNLPFFDDVFDLAFSADLAGALFPARFVSEMERTVRRGGAVVLSVDGSVSAKELEGVNALFKRSSLLEARRGSVLGSEVKLIIMKKKWKKTSVYSFID